MPSQTPLVFDFDGVVADTEPYHWEAWRELLAPYGLELSWEDYRRHCQGVVDTKMAAAMHGVVSGQPPEFTAAELQRRRDLVCARVIASPPIAQPTRDMLRSLTGMTVGLVTTAPRAVAEHALRAAGVLDVFTACVFREDVAHHKPHPEAYLLAAERLGRVGIAFEDSAAGIESATLAGYEVIHVPDPADLPALVAKLL